MSETLGSGRQLLLFPFLGHNHPLTETEADQSMQFFVYENFFKFINNFFRNLDILEKSSNRNFLLCPSCFKLFMAFSWLNFMVQL